MKEDNPSLSDQIRACVWMQRHYRKLANECRDHFDNLVDFYIVYDHYMLAVAVWEDKMEKLFENNGY